MFKNKATLIDATVKGSIFVLSLLILILSTYQAIPLSFYGGILTSLFLLLILLNLMGTSTVNLYKYARELLM